MNREEHATAHGSGMTCLTRRQLLLNGGLTMAVVTLGGIPGLALAEPVKAVKAGYPRRRIGSLSALMQGMPLEFAYPHDNVHNLLVKLGVAAGGGVGPQRDVVAFNQL
ncbi:MAG: arsenate reductase (azurin) small subunit, partial [Magnetococcales bacterium]|nr:arsenate reductase (azurin) small subunit [Magnetococcales bacterium]